MFFGGLTGGISGLVGSLIGSIGNSTNLLICDPQFSRIRYRNMVLKS